MRKFLQTLSIVLLLIGASYGGGYARDRILYGELYFVASLRMTENDQYIPLSDFLTELEKKFDVSIAYRSGLLDGVKVQKPSAQSKTIEESLELILKGSGLTYKKNGDKFYIVYEASISKGENKASGTEVMRVQEKTITGLVKGTDNEPLVGVSVTSKVSGTKVGTSNDGKYAIRLSRLPDTLVFKYMGFLSQEIAVLSQDVVNVTLHEDAMGLSEVVVTAFGLEREKKALGYAVQSVGGEQLAEAR